MRKVPVTTGAGSRITSTATRAARTPRPSGTPQRFRVARARPARAECRSEGAADVLIGQA